MQIIARSVFDPAVIHDPLTQSAAARAKAMVRLPISRAGQLESPAVAVAVAAAGAPGEASDLAAA